MKKFCLTLGAALIGLSSFAGTRVLYQQNFETAKDPAATGWTYGGDPMTIVSDEFGKSLQLYVGNASGGRSGQCVWGASIFVDPTTGESVIGEDGIYYLDFEFSIARMSNNKYDSDITIFTNHNPRANEPYRLPWTASAVGPWSNFVFNLAQCNTAADADMLCTINAPLKTETTTADDGTETITYSIDTSTQYTLETSKWYSVALTVNTLNREVAYVVNNISSGEELTSGTLNVPETDKNGEPITMLAEGIFAMTSRGATTMQFDNFKIYVESDQDFANAPTVALTRLGKTADDEPNLNLRAYTITFGEGETLHVIGTDGQPVEVEYDDCSGEYAYETTTSGTLTAWTTCGTATSEKVETTVDCAPCVLPAATATISSAEVGFAKTYTLSVSNAEVPLQPTIFISYEFKGADGATISKGEDLASGATVTVPCEGTLTLTTASFGYQSTSVDVVNDLEFELKETYDFARMSDETLAKAGFSEWNVLNSSSTSGFNNWTARKRLFYYDLNAPTGEVDDAGNPTYATVYPFGFISEDNTTDVIQYCEVAADAKAHTDFFEGFDIFAADRNVCFMKHLGLYNNETTKNFNYITFGGLDATDFVIVNTIDNYGGDSNHPVVASKEDYYASLAGTNAVYTPTKLPVTISFGGKTAEVTATLNEETSKYDFTYNLFRIQTVLTKITVLNQVGGSGIEAIGADAAVENNDPYYYTIDGIRVAEPTRPGLYIHKGKKLIIK